MRHEQFRADTREIRGPLAARSTSLNPSIVETSIIVEKEVREKNARIRECSYSWFRFIFTRMPVRERRTTGKASGKHKQDRSVLFPASLIRDNPRVAGKTGIHTIGKIPRGKKLLARSARFSSWIDKPPDRLNRKLNAKRERSGANRSKRDDNLTRSVAPSHA